ncbi:MAG: hypothetical protein J6L86_05145 [Alphaproteobacteria bacterium]|nr:hypothetical protein [Alphaproteobacteria bacterium]
MSVTAFVQFFGSIRLFFRRILF